MFEKSKLLSFSINNGIRVVINPQNPERISEVWALWICVVYEKLVPFSFFKQALGIHKYIGTTHMALRQIVRDQLDTEFFAQRLQCSRTDKQDTLLIVQQLIELATFAHDFGLLDLDKHVHQEPLKYRDSFLRKAVTCIVDISDAKLVRQILHNYILSSNYVGQQFLKCIVITEAVLAIQRRADLDHIFSFIIPSLFGMDYDSNVIEVYQNFKMNYGMQPQIFGLEDTAQTLSEAESS